MVLSELEVNEHKSMSTSDTTGSDIHIEQKVIQT